LADNAGVELRHIIGMPPAHAQRVDGFAISKQSLACGLAAATGQSVITPDVSKEPRWEQWLWLANKFDYRACGSFPVAVSSGKVLGSFAMYYKEPRGATPRDLDLISVLTRTAATIISPIDSTAAVERRRSTDSTR
jgi:GAF domain-containing protein